MQGVHRTRHRRGEMEEQLDTTFADQWSNKKALRNSLLRKAFR